MNPAHLPLHQQLAHLRTVLSTNKTLVEVLERAATLRLPNWYLAAGAVSQTIWNHVSGFPPETGIHDYDLIYFDDTDLSYEAEDAVIQSSRALFEPIQPDGGPGDDGDDKAKVKVDVEIRNQARVHLWYEKRFGVPLDPPHASSEAAIDTWHSTSAQIAVRLEDDGQWSVYAPRGLSDFFNMQVRPAPRLGTRQAYEDKVRRWRQIWPALKVEPWPERTEAGERARAQDKGSQA
ncbi:uncharacterized protein B0I36DRAFT_250224 [Microdochium trichocladiopsis]|uniref:Nucleotidyltransferase family protein n=1 Tax=Microdochium trichocladiopsis TaxID=1682393 RepID=A0A9P8XX91_9PEZI|nr:uncharacterized protein B0I36DRAFT_250224 [Microdochium trichocladiopsis]KAH7024513.1 hypothetical protein B0I36DRAFT_250224 [Microdochium trichocladiopsis]